MDSRANSMGERDSGTDSNKANVNFMESTEADSKGVLNPPMYSDLQQDAAKYREDYVMATAMEENLSIKEGGTQPSSITRGIISVGSDTADRQLKPILEIDNGLTQSCYIPYGKDIHSVMDERKLPSSACLTMSLGLYHTKSADTDGNSLTVLNLPGMFASPFEPNGDERNQIKVSGLNPLRTKPRQLLPKQPQMHQPSRPETPKQPQMHQLSQPETPKENSPQVPIRVARPPVEGRGRNQLLPRYWPRITDQELQQITAGDSNSTITPLFEKMLSASDAGRIGRLVLPKACAEAYFPPISQPEGLPLKIQDVSGKDWVFQFRFWPNNNSRMYVLEGVTPCIQSMQLQAGDTVTFSRLDPEGKLVMGYRRAPSSLSLQENQPSTAGPTTAAPPALMGGGGSMDNFSTIASLTGLLSQSVKSVEAQANGMTGHLNLSDTGYGWYKSDKGGYKTKDSSLFHSLLVGDKKKSRPASSKNKRPLTDADEVVKFRITWEEAQDLLRSPPNVAPSIVTIEGYEFEEYEEPPVFGKRTIFTNKNFGPGEDQWAQCDECGSWRKVPADVFLPTRWVCSDNVWDVERNSCNALQEVDNEDIEFLVQHVKDVKKREVVEPLKVTEPLSGLEALANAATAGENNAASSTSPAATTKHPRHRPGCTCIVCIQPPSGKGPKHKPTCNCNVCMTVKRRFKTLMMRRKKRQSEREAEHAARKKRPWTKEDGGEVNSGGKWQNDSYGYSEGVSRQGSLVVAFPGALPRAPNFPATTNGNRFSSNVALTTPYAPRGRNFVDDCKGHIDLNSQPERDEEVNRSAFRVSMMRLLQNASHPLDTYLKEQGLTSLVGPQQMMHPSMSFSRSIVEREADKHTGTQSTMVLSSERSQDELYMALGMARFDTTTD